MSFCFAFFRICIMELLKNSSGHTCSERYRNDHCSLVRRCSKSFSIVTGLRYPDGRWQDSFSRSRRMFLARPLSHRAISTHVRVAITITVSRVCWSIHVERSHGVSYFTFRSPFSCIFYCASDSSMLDEERTGAEPSDYLEGNGTKYAPHSFHPDRV